MSYGTLNVCEEETKQIEEELGFLELGFGFCFEDSGIALALISRAQSLLSF
jgi:hypothetical protein